jgi:hypothetical protein
MRNTALAFRITAYRQCRRSLKLASKADELSIRVDLTT